MLEEINNIKREVEQTIENFDNDKIKPENAQSEYAKAVENIDKLKRQLSEDKLIIIPL